MITDRVHSDKVITQLQLSLQTLSHTETKYFLKFWLHLCHIKVLQFTKLNNKSIFQKRIIAPSNKTKISRCGIENVQFSAEV